MFGNAMGGGAIPVDYQQQMSGCCNEPITGAITEPEETLNSSGNDSGGGGAGGGEMKKNAPLSTEDYFDYDANVESPLSPQGISPPRKNTLVSGKSSDNNNNNGSSSSSSTFQWKSAVNRLWSEISTNTCRCFGEPFSPSRSSSGEAISGSDENTTSSKWKMLSSVTTSATSATTDVYSNNTSAAAQGVSKLKRTPMFSSPVDA